MKLSFEIGTIRAMASHSGRLAAITDSKELVIWNNYEIESIRSFPKRANCILFSLDGESVLIGDKSGDVLRFSITPNADPVLLLGHVSILTCMVVVPDAVVESKRRISHNL